MFLAANKKALASVYFELDAPAANESGYPEVFCILDSGLANLAEEKFCRLVRAKTKVLYFKLSPDAEAVADTTLNIQVFDLRQGFTREQQDTYIASRVEEAVELLTQRHDRALAAISTSPDAAALVHPVFLDTEFLPPASEVSFVIPTLNAGLEFENTLRSIREQRVYGESVLLVVDSGSTDGTVQMAKEFGATVYSYDKDQFNHGATRDFIVGKTTTPFVILLVQDAVLMDSETIPNMLRHMAHEDIAGVYTAPLPVPGHDEFATREVLNYRAYLGPAAKKFSLSRYEVYERLDFHQRLQLVRFDNICSVMRKSAWEKIRFGRIDFGEDISWSTRIQLGGYAVVYDPFARVFHSHMRSPDYSERRHTVELYHVSLMLGGCPVNYGDIALDEVDWVAHEIASDVDRLLKRTRSEHAKNRLTVGRVRALLAQIDLEFQCTSFQKTYNWRAERVYLLELVGAMIFNSEDDSIIPISHFESLLRKAKAAAIGTLRGQYLGSYQHSQKKLTPELQQLLDAASRGI